MHPENSQTFDQAAQKGCINPSSQFLSILVRCLSSPCFGQDIGLEILKRSFWPEHLWGSGLVQIAAHVKLPSIAENMGRYVQSFKMPICFTVLEKKTYRHQGNFQSMHCSQNMSKVQLHYNVKYLVFKLSFGLKQKQTKKGLAE